MKEALTTIGRTSLRVVQAPARYSSEESMWSVAHAGSFNLLMLVINRPRQLRRAL